MAYWLVQIDGENLVPRFMVGRNYATRGLPDHVVVKGEKTDYPIAIKDIDTGLIEVFEDQNLKAKEDYKRKRLKDYPIASEQLEEIYEILKYLNDNGQDLGPSGAEYLAKIEAVKLKHPKE